MEQFTSFQTNLVPGRAARAVTVHSMAADSIIQLWGASANLGKHKALHLCLYVA